MEACATPCPSCPFRRDNDAELQGLIDRVTAFRAQRTDRQFLREALSRGLAISLPEVRERARTVEEGRAQARRRAAPAFACHNTVYNFEENCLRPAAEIRRCAGAEQWKEEQRDRG